MIDAALREVLIRRLRACEQMLRLAASERSPVGQREQQIEVLRNGRIQRNLPQCGVCGAGRQQTLSGVKVGHGRYARDAQPLDQRLKGAEEKSLIPNDGTAEHSAELVAFQCRY